MVPNFLICVRGSSLAACRHAFPTNFYSTSLPAPGSMTASIIRSLLADKSLTAGIRILFYSFIPLLRLESGLFVC